MSLRVGLVGLEPFTHWPHYLHGAATSSVELAAVCHRPELTEEMSADRVALLTDLKLPTHHHLEDMLANERLDVLAAGESAFLRREPAPLYRLENGVTAMIDTHLLAISDSLVVSQFEKVSPAGSWTSEGRRPCGWPQPSRSASYLRFDKRIYYDYSSVSV